MLYPIELGLHENSFLEAIRLCETRVEVVYTLRTEASSRGSLAKGEAPWKNRSKRVYPV